VILLSGDYYISLKTINWRR